MLRIPTADQWCSSTVSLMHKNGVGEARNLWSGGKCLIAAVPRGICRESSARCLLELCLELVLCSALRAGSIFALLPAAIWIASM